MLIFNLAFLGQSPKWHFLMLAAKPTWLYLNGPHCWNIYIHIPIFGTNDPWSHSNLSILFKFQLTFWSLSDIHSKINSHLEGRWGGFQPPYGKRMYKVYFTCDFTKLCPKWEVKVNVSEWPPKVISLVNNEWTCFNYHL